MDDTSSRQYRARSSVYDEQEQKIRDMQRDVLSVLTSSMSFMQTGNYLCRRIQAMAPGVLVSVCHITHNRMCPWAAPDFPVEYGEYFNGMEIGEGVAGCGTAAYRKTPVMIDDIETHPFWALHRHIMIPHGLRSCWTYPVLRRDGTVAGTFAFYFRQQHDPDPWLERIAEASIHLCTLAIEREEHRLQLQQAIEFDPLTGLPNSASLRNYLDTLLNADEHPQDLALFHIRLDRFGDVNTSLGHGTGDLLLAEISGRIRRGLSQRQFLARGDGDTFIMVVPESDIHRARRIAEALLKAIREPVVVDSFPVHPSASVGIYLFRSTEASRDDALSSARNAAVQARQNGGGEYCFFDPEMNRVVRDRLILSASLRQAIEEDKLRLEYQPQVNPADGSITGVEALARWFDPEMGEISPSRFVTAAEESGDIHALSIWILEEACRQISVWRHEGIAIPVLSVNLSPANFRDHKLTEQLTGILKKYDIPASSLVLEITESMMMDISPHTLSMMERLRKLGAGLSVDDFGTGFSSLSTLASLPVTEMKIDRSFIRGIERDERSRALVAAMVSVGRKLGLHVVAEGVEHESEVAFLRKQGCPSIQGYYYSRPVAPEVLSLMLSSGWGKKRKPSSPAAGVVNDHLLRLTHFLSEHYDDLPVWTKVLDTLPVGVSVVSRGDGQIIYRNQEFNRITGYQEESLPTVQAFAERCSLNQSQKQRLLGQIQKILAADTDTMEVHFEQDLQIQGADNIKRTLRHFSVVMKQPGVILAVFIDITDIKPDIQPDK
ncbi:TPA: EAL domain-containing protein [Klebsiella pneumoniae]